MPIGHPRETPACNEPVPTPCEPRNPLEDRLTQCGVHYVPLGRDAMRALTARWRERYEHAFAWGRRLLTLQRALHAYRQEDPGEYLVLPVSFDLPGVMENPCPSRRRIPAYRCRGSLVMLGDVEPTECVVSPCDLAWTMAFHHDDYPCFTRLEWTTPPRRRWNPRNGPRRRWRRRR